MTHLRDIRISNYYHLFYLLIGCRREEGCRDPLNPMMDRYLLPFINERRVGVHIESWKITSSLYKNTTKPWNIGSKIIYPTPVPMETERWRRAGSPSRRVQDNNLSFLKQVFQFQLPKIFLVASNAVYILEDRFLHGIPMYINVQSKWDTFVSIYHRIMLHRPSGDEGEKPFTSLGKNRNRTLLEVAAVLQLIQTHTR